MRTINPTSPVGINKIQRELRHGHAAKVIWLTGLSGAGKSTLANALEIELHANNKFTYLLDADHVRQSLNKDLGFSAQDRSENIRRMAEIAYLLMDAGLIVIVTAISPFLRDRDAAKQRIGSDNFIEVFISTPLSVCEQRDTKGLYKKFRAGQMTQMTGIDSPYEAPKQPDLAIDTSCCSIENGVARIINLLT